MILKNSHKAMSITLFLTCLLLLLLVNFSLSLSKKLPEETYVEVITLDPTEIEDEKEIEILDNATKSTNKAYNTTKNYKQLAQVYKTIEPPKDYENPLLNKHTEEQSPKSKQEKSEGKSKAIKDKELTAFDGVKGVLSRHSNSNPENSGQESINKNSTINYSLIGRTDDYLPVPIYLCESNGKIVVNITVNSGGFVSKASINSSSNTQNACLINHALEHARESRFNASEKTSQLGTITFNFKGK